MLKENDVGARRCGSLIETGASVVYVVQRALARKEDRLFI